MPTMDARSRGGFARRFPRNEVHVWQASLSSQPDGWLDAAMDTLSDEERVRRGRFVRPVDANLFALARAMLRHVLGRYAGMPARTLSFETGAYGKPGLAPDHQLPFRFNVSHSDGVALVAITVDRDVGIDLEAIRPVKDLEGLVERTFSAVEQRAIFSHSDRSGAFFAAWARKEAVVKALGRGIGFPLDAFDVTVDPEAEPAILASREPTLSVSAWRMHGLPPIPGFASAMAVEAIADSVVIFRRWDGRDPA